MLVLVFQIGADRYGLSSAAIEEVIALVNLRRLPDAPPEISGDFNYHGELVPVIDLCQLTLERASHRRWSTRLILTRLADPAATGKLIGLISENATELVSLPASPDASLKLLEPETLLNEAALKFLAAHETEPPEDYRAEENETGVLPEEALVPIKVQKQPKPETETQIRRRRAPRLSHLERK